MTMMLDKMANNIMIHTDTINPNATKYCNDRNIACIVAFRNVFVASWHFHDSKKVSKFLGNVNTMNLLSKWNVADGPMARARAQRWDDASSTLIDREIYSYIGRSIWLGVEYMVEMICSVWDVITSSYWELWNVWKLLLIIGNLAKFRHIIPSSVDGS